MIRKNARRKREEKTCERNCTNVRTPYPIRFESLLEKEVEKVPLALALDFGQLCPWTKSLAEATSVSVAL